MNITCQRLSLGIFCVLLLGALFPPAARGDDIPVHFESERLYYYEEEGIIEGRGNVRVSREQVSLEADWVRFNLETGDMLAEGDVVFRERDEELFASRLEYNFFEERAYALEAETFHEPWFLKAGEFEQVSPERHVLRSATGTTCLNPAPHYRFSARRVEVEPGEVLRSYHNVFFLGRVPVFYLPYFRRTLRDEKSGLELRPGYSSSRGMFGLAYYHWRLSEGLTGRWYLDYYNRLGWGKGFDAELAYDGEMPGRGYLYMYHIDEKQAPAAEREPRERWKMHLRHSQQWSGDMRSILRIDRISDPDYNRDYLTDETLRFLDRSALERHRPEGSFSLAARSPAYSAELYFRKRVNDFTTVVENVPRVSFNLAERNIGDTGLFYNFDTGFANLSVSPSGENGSALQWRGRPAISHQTRFWWLRMNPSVSAEGFWYDRNVEGEENIFQGSYEFNLPVRTAHGIWRTFETPGWNRVEMARHQVLPGLRYSYRPDPPAGRDDLFPFTERVGDERSSVRAELRNILEGRLADGGTFRFLDLDLYSDYDMLADREPWSNITADLRVHSMRDIHLRTRAGYNPYIGRFESASTDVMFSRAGWRYDAGFRIYEPGGEKHTFDLIARIRGDIGANWNLDVEGRYDVNEDRLKTVRAGVIRDLHCWEMQVFWQQERHDTRISLAFRIKGVPGVSLESPY